MDQEQVKIHEQFVKNVDGTTISEIFMLTLPSHFCTFLVILVGVVFKELSHTCCSNCVPKTCKPVLQRQVLIFIKEICTIIVPLVLLNTIFVEGTLLVMTAIMVTSFALLIGLNIFNHQSFVSRKKFKMLLKSPIQDDKRSFVTCCRSIVSIITVVSILAVDFKIFPRRLAKTETHGYSLMDIGVGFFILSNAAVVKIEKVARGGFKQTIIGSSVLFLLGTIRYYTLQNINYQNIIFEYGVHWNFFFTLGTIKLVSYVVLNLFSLHSLLPAIFLGMLHQILLFSCLEDYVLGNKPRDNFIDANREGLVSILGYTSLYLIGVSMNKFILRKSTTVGNDLKTAAKVVLISVTLLLFTVSFSGVFPVSRRIVSFTYITWITSSALLHVALSIVVELFLMCFVLPTTLTSHYYHLTPIIYESINNNGLTFFLLGNLLTGFINILFNTMAMDSLQSLLVLFLYSIVNCGIVFIMYFRQIQLKFW